MARKKVKLAFIENDVMRKATFKKRKNGLLKKAEELTTLCDVDACVLIYSPFDSVPKIWPSSLAVQRMLAKFRKMPIMESTSKMDTQETFLFKRIKKTLEQTKKTERDNRETEVRHLMFQCLSGERALSDLNIVDVTDVSLLIDQTLSEISIHLENEGLTRGESSSLGNNLSFHQEEKPNVAAMMSMVNAQSSNGGQWQEHNNYLSHHIGNQLPNYVNTNMQMMPSENFVTSHNNDGNNTGNQVGINHNNESNNTGNQVTMDGNNGAELWSNGFFPWDHK